MNSTNIGNIVEIRHFSVFQVCDTALILAAREGHAAVVKELLSSGASVDLANKVSTWKFKKSCSSPFYWLCHVELVIKHSAKKQYSSLCMNKYVLIVGILCFSLS